MSSPNPNADGSSSQQQSGSANHNKRRNKKSQKPQQAQRGYNQGQDTQQRRTMQSYSEFRDQQYHYSENPHPYSQQNPDFSHYSESYGPNPQYQEHGGYPQQNPDYQPHYGPSQYYGEHPQQYMQQQWQHQQQGHRSRGQQQGHIPRGQQQGHKPRGQQQLDMGQAPGGGNVKKKEKKAHKTPKKMFEDYWNVTDVQQGLKRGQIIQGAIRINPKNYEDCYIPHPDGHSDIYISGMKNRNRALNGDIVAVLLFDREDWKVLIDDLNNLSEKDLEKSMEKMCLNQKRVENTKQADCTGDSSETKPASVSQPSAEQTASSENLDPASEPEVIVEEEYYEMTETDPKTASHALEQLSSNDDKKELENKEPNADVRRKHDAKYPQNTNFTKGQKNHKGKGGEKCAGQTHTAKKYTSLGDLAANTSALSQSAKKLFQNATHNQQNNEHVPDDVLLRTGKVVYIVEKKHSRACTGHIRLMNDKNPELALFSPLDNRLPRIQVPMADCPKDFLERPEDHGKTLYIAQITDWKDASMFAMGKLKRSLGEAGQIEPETEGILIENDVDFSEFSDKALACLPQELPWSIPATEIATRKDLRKQCIFTIDPSTARDLDDALSCVALGNGVYEIGVHIADVSYFLPPHTDLDTVAASRATSVYMVQKVIPMLPRLLCEQLCSLNPDEDRLTFSVVWTVTEDGTVESEWFGRSIIRSCVKLSYDHAQGFIEQPTRDWHTDELPAISQGYSAEKIRDTVLLLDKVAKKLRKHRFDNGALRLDQIKLQFALDKETGLPNGYYVYHQKDSNRLVEEFMLLANMAVARKIYKHYPEIAVLRRHPQPQSRMIDDVGKLCSQLGVPLDVTSSRTIQQSLAAYSEAGEDNQAKFLILTALCSKPMQNARYFCTGVLEDESLFHHYALNVPFYTHFTSPIRRYPDIMVHRLLAAALGYCTGPKDAKGEVQAEAEQCNDKKTSAKRCSDLSSQLYFAVFVKECGPLEEQGMVMAVLDKAFDVLIIKLGVIKRVYCEKLPLSTYSYRKDKKTPQLNLVWKRDETHPQEKHQFITIFTSVNCRLSSDPDPIKWNAVTLHPDDVLST